jgi:hypothetical protein
VVRRVPRNSNKDTRRASTTRIRADAYAQLERLDTYGVETCGGDCAGSWPLGRCEHHEVERRLGYAIDPAQPSDLAIGCALRLIAEQRDYEGVDHRAQIIEAANSGTISPGRCSWLLGLEDEIYEADVEAAAFELLTTRVGSSTIGSTRDRRWRRDLDNDEQRERRRLEELRLNGGFTPADQELYLRLTEPQPLEPVDWDNLPKGVRDEAERIVEKQRRRARGDLPRDRRISKTDRRRVKTYEVPSFREQIGQIGTTTTTADIERAVRDLRHNAKRLGRIPADHDRRRRERSVSR